MLPRSVPPKQQHEEQAGKVRRLIEERASDPKKHPRDRVRNAALAAQGANISGREILTGLHERDGEKSFLGFVVREKWVFPNAPSWSPVFSWKVPYITSKFLQKPKRYGRIHAEVSLPFRKLQLREKYLFPNAPKWSPLHGLSAPAVVVMKKRRPPPRPKQQDHTLSH